MVLCFIHFLCKFITVHNASPTLIPKQHLVLKYFFFGGAKRCQQFFSIALLDLLRGVNVYF